MNLFFFTKTTISRISMKLNTHIYKIAVQIQFGLFRNGFGVLILTPSIVVFPLPGRRLLFQVEVI
ncbi:MAG: hypothetical protein KTR26_11050 [Flammeovirgaceae bacterium]|nr:hypothetical protein [Flammeovirgaceae bacterium]